MTFDAIVVGFHRHGDGPRPFRRPRADGSSAALRPNLALLFKSPRELLNFEDLQQRWWRSSRAVTVGSMVRTAALTLVLSVGCSAPDMTTFDDGRGGSERLESAPRLPYPPPPYGAVQGAIIENFQFLGWSDPRAVGYDLDRLEALSLAQFYNPTNATKLRYIVITSTAVWCSACKLEYQDFASGRVDEYHGRGVEFLGALFEDNDSNPAKPSDLRLWASQFKVNFPFGLDPALKLGAFFDVEATPMEMIVDVRTMKIVLVSTGWATSGPASLWTALDQLLGA